ncbi:MAG: hypothetical protein E7507_04115 [Ruminococcus sp.]|nr:hypothetical protein [Ruminococcus sp.]
MSGPKYGQIIIGAIRRHKLMKELDTALEKRECKALRQKQTALQQRFDKLFSENSFDDAEKLLSEAIGKIPNSVSVSRLNKYLNELSGIKKMKCSLEGDSKALNSARVDSVERFFRAGNLIHLMTSAVNDVKRELAAQERSKQMDDFLSSDMGREEIIDVTSNELSEVYYTLLEELAQSENYEIAKASAEEIMHNSEYTYEHKEELLKMRIESIRVERKASHSDGERMELESRLETLCEYLGKEIPVAENIYKLRDDVKALEQEAEQVSMGDYISDSMREIMGKLGYNIVGSETLVGKNYETEKDFYEFSDSSVLNVSTNNEGAVLFEVVGRSDNGELSMGDKIAVKDDMDKFCPDYQRIKDMLAEYDLDITDERTCEADIRYVRAVKNDILTQRKDSQRRKARREMRNG